MSIKIGALNLDYVLRLLFILSGGQRKITSSNTENKIKAITKRNPQQSAERKIEALGSMEKPLVALKVFSPIPATIWDVKEAKMDIQSAAQVLTPSPLKAT